MQVKNIVINKVIQENKTLHMLIHLLVIHLICYMVIHYPSHQGSFDIHHISDF